MESTVDIDQLNPDQVHELAVRLLAENRYKQTVIDKLTHENVRIPANVTAHSGERDRCV